MENFTPVSAIIGGVFIGCAAVILMLFHGRIAGISGILAGSISRTVGSTPWQRWFIAGLVAGPLVVWFLSTERPEFSTDVGYPVLVLGGLLVGFGTRLGSGCTSGHGVCGLARLSIRSLVAVLVFLAAGVVTATLFRVL